MKKHLAFFLTSSLLVAFAACNGADEPQDVLQDTKEPSDEATTDDAPTDDADVTKPDDGTQDTPELPPTDTDDGGDADIEEPNWWEQPCEAEDLPRCSDDAYVKFTCTDGKWEQFECMKEKGQLCEDGACIDPWHYGNPTFGTCPNPEFGTQETLAQKAAYYDDIAARLHIHPDLKWAAGATLKKVEVACADGEEGPCYAPIKSDLEATYEDVESWHTGENDGLWSALYLTSQAYRYAVTKSPEALANIKLLLEGEVIRMKITGVPGLFTRQYIPPHVPGIACPDPETLRHRYTTDEEKDDNQWVQIREDGCAWVVDRVTDEWTTTPGDMTEPHCGLDEFAGWCWLDNVSQDEYAGHMLALGAILKLVDDPEVVETVKDLNTQVAQHLVDNWLYFIDWDGRMTEHGRLQATCLAGFPGFLATLALNYILQGAVSSDDANIWHFYNECLLRKGGKRCEGWPYQVEEKYQNYLNSTGLYLGEHDCLSNWNNMNMILCAMHNLIWFEQEPTFRELYQDTMVEHITAAPDTERTMIKQKNAWFNFAHAAMKKLGPNSDGPAFETVEQGICALKEFPATKQQTAKDTVSISEHYCKTRLDGSDAQEPFSVAQRCIQTFMWWGDPYNRRACSGNQYYYEVPGDYLMAYWMGRYYGFIPEDL